MIKRFSPVVAASSAPAAVAIPGIGHNSVQVPHDGKIIPGIKPKKLHFFRPTTMSVAMAKAGLIPDVHLVKEMSKTGILRNFNDNNNIRPSIRVAL